MTETRTLIILPDMYTRKCVRSKCFRSCESYNYEYKAKLLPFHPQSEKCSCLLGRPAMQGSRRRSLSRAP
ncbi:hypothetical protein E2C01_050730 [Portunus trituberculatus]|uniref:Uncharacterized protein n=1 Tax=Portunus trituberculatus TaxID=210409 RepID=A0A5B7GJR1_PORTR|nr:hypothetical protein [Portunus trituberculatus]